MLACNDLHSQTYRASHGLLLSSSPFPFPLPLHLPSFLSLPLPDSHFLLFPPLLPSFRPFLLLVKMYLRRWSRELDTPIVSIDYTLAPEGAFPRALDEIIFAYVWILLNSELLGVCSSVLRGCFTFTQHSNGMHS